MSMYPEWRLIYSSPSLPPSEPESETYPRVSRAPSPLLDALEKGTGYEVAPSSCKYARLIFVPVSKGRIRLGLIMGPERRETSAVFEPPYVLRGVAEGVLKELKGKAQASLNEVILALFRTRGVE